MELAVAAQPPALNVIQEGHTIEALLEKYSPVMYRAALRKLGNAEDAEDALQDALLSASRKFEQFKGECHISTWLVAIAINAARMQMRRQFRHRAASLDETSHDGETRLVREPTDYRPNPEQIYRKVELRGIISQLTVQLSPPLRKAFHLRVFEGLSIREAAQALGVTEGTLKAQFFRARARIKPLMREVLGLPRQAKSRKNGSRFQSGRQHQILGRATPSIAGQPRCHRPSAA
jgi:RNA polymerase sigma-70 factor, ECF subfamily